MAKITAQQSKAIERTQIGKGKHVLILKEVKPYERENKYKGGLKENRLAWIFEKDGSDDPLNPGHPIQYTEFTGLEYGFDLARLTTLLDWLMPDVEPEFRQTVDTDHLIGRRFNATIQIKDNDDGTKRPVAMFIEPSDGGLPTIPTTPKFDPDELNDSDSIPFDGGVTTTPPQAVSDEVKAALGKAMLALGVDETTREKFKADLLVKLGQLRYGSYADFVAHGNADALKVLLFVQSWGVPA